MFRTKRIIDEEHVNQLQRYGFFFFLMDYSCYQWQKRGISGTRYKCGISFCMWVPYVIINYRQEWSKGIIQTFVEGLSMNDCLFFFSLLSLLAQQCTVVWKRLSTQHPHTMQPFLFDQCIICKSTHFCPTKFCSKNTATLAYRLGSVIWTEVFCQQAEMD